MLQTLNNTPFFPNKFLDAYNKEHKNLFFGRDKEIETIATTLEKTKLLVIYGPSGVGKTSLLQCGIFKKIKEEKYHPLFVRRNNNIVDSLKEALLPNSKKKKATNGHYLVTSLEKNEIEVSNKDFVSNYDVVEDMNIISKPKYPSQTVNELLNGLYKEVNKPILLIFDQFEELFILGKKEEKKIIILEIADILNSEIKCKIIIGLREEYWYELYDFEKEITDFLNYSLRVNKINKQGVQKIINETAKKSKLKFEKGFPELITEKIVTPQGIELTHLQVYLRKIISELDSNFNLIYLGTEIVDKIEPFEIILANFLDNEITKFQNPEMAVQILKTLVTKDGTRRQLNVLEINHFLNLIGRKTDVSEIIIYLQKFIKSGIVNEKNLQNKYELSHDCLAKKVYSFIDEFEKELIEFDHVLINSLSFYQEKGILLNKEELEYITKFENKVLKVEEFKPIIEKSKNKIRQNTLKKRILSTTLVTSLLFLCIFLGFYFSDMEKYKIQIENLQKNVTKQSKDIIKLAGDLVHQANLTKEQKRLNEIKAEEVKKLSSTLDLQTRLATINKKIADEQKLFALEKDSLNQYQLGQILFLQRNLDSTNLLVTSTRKLNSDLEMKLLQLKALKEVSLASTGNVDLVSRSNELSLKAMLKIDEDPILSFRLAENAFYLHKSQVSIQALVSCYNSPLFNKCILGIRKSRLLIISENSLGSLPLESSISPDGKAIVLPSEPNMAVIWDLNGNKIKELTGHSALVSAAKFSPSGNFLVTVSNDKMARVWLKDGQLKTILKGHKHYVTSVDFSPDEKRIITGSWDKKINIWDTSGILLNSFIGHKEAVTKVLFSINGNHILTGSLDNTVRLWDIDGNQLLRIDLTDEKFINTYFKSGNEIVVVTDKNSRIFEFNGTLKKEFNGSIVIFSPDRKLMLEVYKNKLSMVDANGRIIGFGSGGSEWITGATFSFDSKIIATRSFNIIKLWDINGNELVVLKGHKKKIEDIRFSKDNKYLVSTSSDGVARIWLIEPTEIIRKVNDEKILGNIPQLSLQEKKVYGIPDAYISTL